MPLHINVVCDSCKEVAQGVWYDSPHEKFLGLLEALRDAGWDVENMFSPQKEVEFICPKCVDNEE